MEQSLKDFLVSHAADTDTIQQAARYYINEQLDYPSPQSIARQLREIDGPDAEIVEKALDEFKANGLALTEASLAVLSYAWEETGDAKHVQRAVEAAKGKLPIIDPTMLAGVAVFGILYINWLMSTRGKEESVTIVKYKPDGSLEEEIREKFYPSPLSELGKLCLDKIFGAGGQSLKDKPDSSESDDNTI